MSAKRDQSEGSLEGAEEEEDDRNVEDREEESYYANEAGNDQEEDVYYEGEEGDEEGDDGYESTESGDRTPAAGDTLDSEQQPKPKKRRRRRVISTLQESKWQQMYQRLLIFRQMTGDCLVPNRYTADPSLGAWVATQRRNYRVFMAATDEPSGMTAERVRSLEGIGFQWTTTDPRHEPWDVRYEALREFVGKYGHAEIPMRWEENVQLSNWVSKQRQDYKLRMKGKSSRLTDDRMQKLNDLGFKWHIPRKGRKIKQKTIPIIRRQSNSTDGGYRPAQGSEAGVSIASGAAGGGNAGSHAPGPSQPSTARMPSLADFGSLPGNQAGGQPVGVLNPAALLGLQQATNNSFGLDIGALLGIQGASSNPPGSAAAGSRSGLANYPSAQGGVDLSALFGLQNTSPDPPANRGTPYPDNAEPSTRAQRNPPAAMLFPAQLGHLMSTLQQQQQVPGAASLPGAQGVGQSASSATPSTGLGLQATNNMFGSDLSTLLQHAASVTPGDPSTAGGANSDAASASIATDQQTQIQTQQNHAGATAILLPIHLSGLMSTLQQQMMPISLPGASGLQAVLLNLPMQLAAPQASNTPAAAQALSNLIAAQLLGAAAAPAQHQQLQFALQQQQQQQQQSAPQQDDTSSQSHEHAPNESGNNAQFRQFQGQQRRPRYEEDEVEDSSPPPWRPTPPARSAPDPP